MMINLGTGRARRDIPQPVSYTGDEADQSSLKTAKQFEKTRRGRIGAGERQEKKFIFALLVEPG